MAYLLVLILLIVVKCVLETRDDSENKFVVSWVASCLIFILALAATFTVSDDNAKMHQNTIDALNGDLKYDTLTLDKTGKLVEIKILKE